ncbi:uncharacterized protein TNCV_178251 [Trichonephila clavipes]|nr:uncharacterized protein TNCV_178251 [Trichonephila clavipes]
MCLPNPVSQKAYDRINAKIADISEALANASMKKAAAEEKIIDGTVNSVVVNGDGTWKTRGHTSLIGVCALIGADCGKVLDMEVMSSYCKGCDSYKGPKFGPKYSAFLAKHQIFCRKNHSGSAKGMEVCGMQKNFFRSEQKHGLKYQRYIGDGDSKSFSSIAEKNPCGDSVPIEKIECVGHVQNYGCPVWAYAANSNIKLLDNAQNALIRNITRAYRYNRNRNIYKVLKIPTFKAHIKKLGQKLFDNLSNINNVNIQNLENYDPNIYKKRPRRILLDSYNPP